MIAIILHDQLVKSIMYNSRMDQTKQDYAIIQFTCSTAHFRHPPYLHLVEPDEWKWSWCPSMSISKLTMVQLQIDDGPLANIRLRQDVG